MPKLHRVNSEVSKKREAVEKRLSNVQRFREAARIKAHRATLLSTRLRKEAKEHGERLYRGLNERLQALEAQGVTEGRDFVERRKQKTDVDAELETYRQRVYRVEAKSYQESSKHERYCRKPRELLRTLEELTAHERVMHELDNRKDHIMIGGLAGLGESGDVGAGPFLSFHLCACHAGLVCFPFFA